MAMAANSNSPTSSPSTGDGSGRLLPSPWAQVVRGGGVELESSSGVPVPCSPTSTPPISAGDSVPPENNAEAESVAPESESNDNAAASKKPVWRKPSNGVVEGTSVMGGAISWPALGESTRSTAKSSTDSSSSTKPVVDGSTPISQGPIIAQTPQKPANANNNANANHGLSRQRLMKNRNNSQGFNNSQGVFSKPLPSPPTPPPMPPPFPSNVNYGGNVVPPPVLESSVRGPRPASSPRTKRNNFSRPRGDGQYHGSRRDHDRNLPQFVPPPPGSYMPPPPPSPGSAPFLSPPPMRPFVPPMGFDMPPPPYLYVPALPPYMAPPPPPPMYYPIMDPPPLHALIIKQIDYYFSDSNLVKDDYLRSNMDDEGWVPLDLIAKFPRVQQLTTEIPLILESLKGSMVVEVKERGDKLRRRNDWRKWVHTGSSQISPKSKKEVSAKPEETLSSSINKISLNEGTSSPSPEDSSAVANGDALPEELEALST